MKDNYQASATEKEFSEKVVQISRVSKKTKGGNQISFSALLVVGDKKGKVGVSLGKAPDVLSAIKKGVRQAKKNMIKVPLHNGTIPFAIQYKRGAAKIYLKPAPNGSGVIAGGAVRAVVEAAGVTDVVGKILGTNNQLNNVYTAFHALKEISRLVKLKGMKLNHTPQKAETHSTSKKSTKVSASTKPHINTGKSKSVIKPKSKAESKKIATQ